jgi:hypothetical protein
LYQVQSLAIAAGKVVIIPRDEAQMARCPESTRKITKPNSQGLFEIENQRAPSFRGKSHFQIFQNIHDLDAKNLDT